MILFSIASVWAWSKNNITGALTLDWNSSHLYGDLSGSCFFPCLLPVSNDLSEYIIMSINDDHQQSFIQISSSATATVVLALPKPTAPTVAATDQHFEFN